MTINIFEHFIRDCVTNHEKCVEGSQSVRYGPGNVRIFSYLFHVSKCREEVPCQFMWAVVPYSKREIFGGEIGTSIIDYVVTV